EEKLLMAMSDPGNVFAIDDLRIVTGFDIKPVVSSESSIMAAIDRYYKMDKTVEQVTANVEEDEAELAISESMAKVVEDAPIVKFVNLIITQAINDRASDIHIEPQEKDLRIRYRIDGVLHEVMTSPKRIQSGVISRLKIMADMNIAERRVPQDGRCGLVVSGKTVDIRVATLPTVYGEKIVIRILEKSTALLGLDELGFQPKTLERFKVSFTKPYGAILVTGPTGSGKSTTLYSTLNVLNSPEKNTITVEDPVEYRLAGINQVQTNVKAGLTFASGLRSILRCDPDIVMIGEIRDKETAQIAVESALTGHLVLSTLHTNNAAGALTRLTEMGIEPFLISSSVDCILAQRLARILCKNCKEPYTPGMELLKELNFPFTEGEELIFHKAKGCPRCNNTGYKGRMGVYEVLRMSETIEKMTIERKSDDEITKVAISEGMATLREDGWQKVKMGITSPEEVLRVIV
ncbi:MAG: Flp pilus assembly complex ATPase component TadA, partial [Actinobacteria bacterium]|nr:Flp pilus assembly complex ATPase component TadA [Actinomycetota bacterium]